MLLLTMVKDPVDGRLLTNVRRKTESAMMAMTTASLEQSHSGVYDQSLAAQLVAPSDVITPLIPFETLNDRTS